MTQQLKESERLTDNLLLGFLEKPNTLFWPLQVPS